MATQAKPPEKTFALGNVNATVWVNDSTAKEFRTVKLEQRFKQGDDWKSSNSFTLEQLLRLQVCIGKAVDHLTEQEMGES